VGIQLTEQQEQALVRDGESPPRVYSQATKTFYVLLTADAYERVRTYLDEDGVRSMEPLLGELAKEDWEVGYS
jgi:hypothetical protein